ncbi:MAG: CPBP family intramembrane glutamic endopeptidase [Candidatus Thorarchaeota archaeon]
MEKYSVTISSIPNEGSLGYSKKILNHIRRHPVRYYSLVAYLIPWIGSLLVVGPKFLTGEPVTLLDSLYMWVPMLLGPSLGGISLTYLVKGRSGLNHLFSRMRRWRASLSCYAIAFLLPPVAILFVLTTLSIIVSPVYTPGMFLMGVIIGLITGFFEEIGWIGFLYPALKESTTSFNAAIKVGLIHGGWHLMAAYLGSSQWLGIYFIPYFVSMWIIGMTAMRVLQVWVHNSTNDSVLMVQLMHGSSTGFLLALTPVVQAPSTETFWFFILAVVLWIVVSVVIKRYGTSLKAPTDQSRRSTPIGVTKFV